MAPFNKRQIGYIKAIANVGKHKSFVHSRYDGSLTDGLALTSSNSTISTGSKKCTVHLVQLHRFARVADQRASQYDISDSWPLSNSDYCIQNEEMTLLDCAAVPEGDAGKIDEDGTTLPDAVPDTAVVGGYNPTTERIGSEFFLDKTHLRMRFTMPDFDVMTGKQPHYEYRLIVFRTRKPQITTGDAPTALTGGSSFINHAYDLFNGYVGRPVGIAGWRGRLDFDGHQHYSGMQPNFGGAGGLGFSGGVAEGKTAKFPPGETDRTADDLMTLPLNDADYIVKCDERFFLGPEHGKSHYEKVISWDWNQQGETLEPDLAKGLDPTFNPLWKVMLIGTSNDNLTPNLNILYRGTTTIESA